MALIDNLVSYWKLDEASGQRADSHDSLPLDQSSGTINDFTPGKIINAANFVPADVSVLISANTLTQTGLNNFSISFWATFDDITSGRIPMAHWANASGNWDWKFEINGSGKMTMQLYDGSTQTSTVGTNTLSVGPWHHFVFTYNGSAALGSRGKLYLNGILNTASDNTTATHQTWEGKTTIGGRQFGTSGVNHDGLIDEVGFWSRTLTASDAFALYNSGDAVAYPFVLNTANILVVGGGGGGGWIGGGGGAGGAAFISTYPVYVSTNYTVTIGAGGAGGLTGNIPASDGVTGSNSLFGILTGYGGGGAGGGDNRPGLAGGSGGGGSYNGFTTGGAGVVGQGFAGGNGVQLLPAYGAGGGGGAGAVGLNGTSVVGGSGGIGVADAAVGNLLSLASAPFTNYIAGGGGGIANNNASGVGGLGGGGRADGNAGAGQTGTANTGGGGGSSSGATSGFHGGSGIVIASFPTATFGSFTSTGALNTDYFTGTSGPTTWVKWVTVGSYTFQLNGPFKFSPFPSHYN